MKRRASIYCVALILAGMVMVAESVMAEQVVTPSTLRVPLPAAEAAKPAPQDNFPVLPPSEPCTSKDVLGLWQLAQVYESPSGTERSSFLGSPMQYLFFSTDSTFARYNAGRNPLPAAEVIRQIRDHTSALLQYIVEKGILFLYQNQVANETQACFIVHMKQGDFSVGQMLLMPPKGQIAGRLVKVYQRPASTHPVMNPNPQARRLTPQQIQQQRAQQLRLQQQRLRQQQQR